MIIDRALFSLPFKLLTSSGYKLLVGAILSFGFSIAVVLGTIGLMDGFEIVLKDGLRKAEGDIYVTFDEGYIDWSSREEAQLSEVSQSISSTSIIRTHAFLVYNETSHGVLVQGVDESFQNINPDIDLLEANQVVIGDILAKELNLKVGSEIVLMLSPMDKDQLPLLLNFKVKKTISHGIYEKDKRFIYVAKKYLSSNLKLGDKINLLLLKIISNNKDASYSEINKLIKELKTIFSKKFIVKPFWNDFNSILQAVKVEKLSLTLMVQLIVLVALFNIVSFVFYVLEKQAKEFFLLRAIGLSLKKLLLLWGIILFFVWFLGCLLGLIFLKIFSFMLTSLDFLQVPGDIYIVSQLKIVVSLGNYFFVYIIALVWILMAVGLIFRRLKSQPMITGLREEFQ